MAKPSVVVVQLCAEDRERIDRLLAAVEAMALDARVHARAVNSSLRVVARVATEVESRTGLDL